MKKQLTSSPSPNIPCSEQFVPLFDDIFVCSIKKKVDATSCIPFARIRNPTDSGILRLATSFDNSANIGEDIMNAGFVVGSKMALVVSLADSFYHHVPEHFKSVGHKEGDVAEIVPRHDTWYGIIDGSSTSCALRYLKEHNGRWHDFM